jgi:hypothetical protein
MEAEAPRVHPVQPQPLTEKQEAFITEVNNWVKEQIPRIYTKPKEEQAAEFERLFHHQMFLWSLVYDH